jgi:predicted phosphodiesterase
LRILSLSDIHGELEDFGVFVDQLPKLNFDVVLIAGDLGERKDAKIIIRKLAAFGKPIFYVMGNWDSFSYEESLHRQATHIHLKHQRIGEWIFLGYSGSAANGYKDHPTLSNSFATYQSNRRHNKRKFGSYESYCKTLIVEELSTYISVHQIDVEDLVLVTHDRLYAPPFFPLLYVFGHRHQPKYTTHKGVHLVNTSAISMSPIFSSISPDAVGNFCLIELEGLNCRVEFHKIPSTYVAAEGADLDTRQT